MSLLSRRRQADSSSRRAGGVKFAFPIHDVIETEEAIVSRLSGRWHRTDRGMEVGVLRCGDI